MKIFLYEKLGIDNDINNNSSTENFIKGVIDGGILDNYDLLVQIYETNGKIILDGIKQLLTWEGLKKLAESLKQDLWTLWEGNAYEKGKVSAEVVLGLITAGAGLTVSLTKKGVKQGIKLTTKQIAKLRVNKEKLVENSKLKQTISETRNKIDEIVPKQEMDLEKELKRSVERKRQIEGLEKLGISESLSKDILESGLLNEKFFGGDLFKRFEVLEKKGVDYNSLVDDVIRQILDLTREEALLIFTYTDNTIYRKLNAFMRGDKNVLKTMTKENIEASRKLALKLEKAVEKMPDMEGKLFFRGDNWNGYNGNIGDEIKLSAFSSVFNIEKDAFISKERNILLIIKGKKGRVKDISKLAIGVNFGVTKKELETLTDFTGKVKIPKTNNEGVILPRSIIKIVGKTITEENGFLINKIRFKQIK